MLKKETQFKNSFRKKLEMIPGIYFVKIQQLSINGTPDFFLCVNGLFMGIELKKDEHEEPSELQKWNLAKINKSGGIGVVAHPKNAEKILNVIKIISKGGKYDRANVG